MKITNVHVKKIKNNDPHFIGVASVVIDDVFVIKNIKIIKNDKRVFLSMPNQKMPDGKYSDLSHPLTSDCRQMFEDIILSKFNEV